MRVMVLAGGETDISRLVTEATWSGDKTQAARKFEFSFVQSDRDAQIPAVRIDAGYTVAAYSDAGELFFRGNIYALQKDRANDRVKVTAFDNLFILNKSKTTRRFTDALPEDIARAICGEMGIKCGAVAQTGVAVSFIANAKSGYQIIQGAYTEAHKINGRQYQCVMEGDALNVIEKGALCGATLSSAANMTDSIYKISIENLINAVTITDAQGNGGEVLADADSISKYSMIRAVYKTQADKDAQKEARALLSKPERGGNVTVLGDYRLKSGYSVIVQDSLFTGQFWIKSDTHHFSGGLHSAKLALEFENLMDEVRT